MTPQQLTRRGVLGGLVAVATSLVMPRRVTAVTCEDWRRFCVPISYAYMVYVTNVRGLTCVVRSTEDGAFFDSPIPPRMFVPGTPLGLQVFRIGEAGYQLHGPALVEPGHPAWDGIWRTVVRYAPARA